MPVTYETSLSDLVSVIALALETFGTRERVIRWFETTNPKLGGKTPIRVFRDSGPKEIEEELMAIQHGLVA